MVEKYDYFTGELDLNNKPLSMLFHVSYFVRRIVLVLVAFTLHDFPLFQVFSLIVIDMIAVIVQGLVNP